MKYNDEILENKAFNFFKQLMYNIALAICIMLVGVLAAVYLFGFRLYVVDSGSEEPYLPVDCMIVVKAQDSYKVGDIIKFDESSTKSWPTTHRLIAIVKDSSGTDRYICHGDNVQNVDGSRHTSSDWEDDRDYILNLIEQEKTFSEILELCENIQTPTFAQIEGKVVNHIYNYGAYIRYIKTHYMLIVALVAGVWCINSVVQNEIDMKKCRRLI